MQGSVFEQFVDLGTRQISIEAGNPQAKGARDVPGYGVDLVRGYQLIQGLVARHCAAPMHIKHLYGKPDVRNRVQAVVQAQVLQLLS